MGYSSDDSDAASVEVENEMAPVNARIPVAEAFDLSSNILKLRAGQDKEATTIQIHQDVLLRSSEYFKRVMKREWAEQREDPNIIDMGPTHTADDIKTYCNWLYSGSIPTRDFDRHQGSNYINIDLANAYVFGENILDQKYRRAVLETIAGVQHVAPDYPPADAFAIVYDGTPEDSPARRLLVDMYAYGAVDTPCWNKEFDLMPHEALADVLRATIKVRRENPSRPWRETMVAYQEKE